HSPPPPAPARRSHRSRKSRRRGFPTAWATSGPTGRPFVSPGRSPGFVVWGKTTFAYAVFVSSPLASSRLYCCSLLRKVLRLMPRRVAGLVFTLLDALLTFASSAPAM